jgi:magnesium chelatase accessory protein
VTDRPVWERDGRDWPNREASRFVRAAGLRWHVQVMGQGPALLLAHGTAATTHSWRALAPLLATRFTVVAPDLPGHGFTEAPPAVSLTVPGMACALAELLDTLTCGRRSRPGTPPARRCCCGCASTGGWPRARLSA